MRIDRRPYACGQCDTEFMGETVMDAPIDLFVASMRVAMPELWIEKHPDAPRRTLQGGGSKIEAEGPKSVNPLAKHWAVCHNNRMDINDTPKPTTCDCPDDQANCRSQPGHLLPGQLATIAAHLNLSLGEARGLFRNSPGMVLWSKRDGAFRVRTITPHFENGACVFLKDGRCSIYEVAPFGCRYFDVHMDREEANRRAHWGVMQLFENYEAYEAERDALDEATHYRPRLAL